MKKQLHRVVSEKGLTGILRIELETIVEKKAVQDICNEISRLGADGDLGSYSLQILGYSRGDEGIGQIDLAVKYLKGGNR